MIRVIEGTPGSGKTCWVIEQLLREIDKGTYTHYFSNIADLRVCGVNPIPVDYDWRDPLPRGLDGVNDGDTCLFIFDEAQYELAFMRENRKDNPVGKDLSTHRHRGIDLWLITQSSSLLNDYVHSNTGEHVFLYRPRKRKSVKIYWWSHIQKSLSKDAFKRADDEQTWRLNPAMFSLYRSTVAVTDGSSRKSTKLFSILFTAVLVFSFIGYMINAGLGSFNKMRGVDDNSVLTVSPSGIANKLDGVTVPVPVTAPVAPPVAPPVPVDKFVDNSLSVDNSVDNSLPLPSSTIPVGALMLDGACWAYNIKSEKVEIPEADCQLYLSTLVE